MIIEPITVGIIGICLLGFLVVIGMHVAYAGALVGLVGIVITIGARRVREGDFWDIIEKGWGPGLSNAGTIPFSELAHYSLSVLPMFILIGYMAFHARLTQGAFYCMRMWFGHLPGGLAIATVFATGAFAAVSGASTATAAVFSRIAIPEMLRYGYPAGFSAGVVAAGGTLASLIPPSGILVIYAIIVEESVGKLLLAGFIPGVISAIIYAGSIMVRVKLNPELGGTPIGRVTWGERFASFGQMWGIVFVVFVIMGGIYSGWMTPTESGAVGAFVVFLLALRNGMTKKQFVQGLTEAAKTSVMIITIIWGILILVRFLGFSDLPNVIKDMILGLDVNRYVVLLIILLMYMVLGMFMDAIGMLLLTLPLVQPLVLALGFDAIWFGIIVVKMVEICLITPPIGLNCFVVAGVRPDIPLGSIFKGIWWFFVCDILTVALFVAFPAIVLWLPNNMLGR
ncbi:MAG: TRAP transporter large permease [Gammaproteobacteria bacterium]|nr:TRAP transporter large permease [Gammaproteobacteria bacterium]